MWLADHVAHTDERPHAIHDRGDAVARCVSELDGSGDGRRAN